MKKPNNYRVVVTEESGESYIIAVRATDPQQAECAVIDACTNFYGETFKGLATAMI